MFEVIPAIDVRDGRCVRLTQGDFDQSITFADDPVEVACRWEAAGARRIHVVDLDAARLGRPTQQPVVRAIVDAVGVPVQLGGGIRGHADLDTAFAAGVDRAILGTAALEDPAFLAESLARYGDRIVVGVDSRAGRVAVRGWYDVSTTDAVEFARRLAGAGVRTIVYTDIARDGMLGGPNVDAMRQMVAAVPDVGIIASGGVSHVDDLLALQATGAVGAIVGKALYTGRIDLRDAITVVRRPEIANARKTEEC